MPGTTTTTQSTTLESKGIYLLSGEITEVLCSNAIRYILETNIKEDPNIKKIRMIINSPGGAIEPAFALIDIMESSKIPVQTFGLGQICSAGLLLFMTGEKGTRTITKNTSVLSHQWVWGSYGKQHELIARTKEFDLIQDRILQHYKIHTGLNETKIKKDLLPPEDKWLTPEEAIKFKLADVISTLKM